MVPLFFAKGVKVNSKQAHKLHESDSDKGFSFKVFSSTLPVAFIWELRKSVVCFISQILVSIFDHSDTAVTLIVRVSHSTFLRMLLLQIKFLYRCLGKFFQHYFSSLLHTLADMREKLQCEDQQK